MIRFVKKLPKDVEYVPMRLSSGVRVYLSKSRRYEVSPVTGLIRSIGVNDPL